MNKNLYFLYEISKQIKKQYSSYNKYGFNSNITSLTNKLTKQQSFIITKKTGQKEFQTGLPVEDPKNTFITKHKSFLQVTTPQEESFENTSKVFNYVLNEKNTSDSLSTSGTLFCVENYATYEQSVSANFFKLESVVEKKESLKSFKIPKDFTTDFRNIEDWASIQNKPYDSLLRENFLQINENDSPASLSSNDNIFGSLKSKKQESSWVKDSDLFYNSYIKNTLSSSCKSTQKNFISNQSGTLKVWQELEELINSDSFSQTYKNDILVEQLITDDLQSVYKNRLSTEKKLRWFYGLLTKSAFNRLIHPFNSNRSLSSKKSLGSSVLNQLESRLDIQLFRMGWVPTITAARQLVKHNHVLVWSKKNYSGFLENSNNSEPEKRFSSYSLQKGDIILLKPKSFSILQTYWDISNLATTENRTKGINNLFSYKFPWYLFENSSVLNSTASRWDTAQQGVAKNEIMPVSFVEKAGVIRICPDLGDQLTGLIDFNKGEDVSKAFRSLSTSTGSSLGSDGLSSHLEYNSKLMFHLYRKAPNLSALRFSQLDPNKLKSFLFSHN